ncbi:MAG TPA: hypothetical protein VK308_15970, partial [Pyrinomonadaceae bacterium]|nr:hypothetical protein [Pyrinomonadaceae bacterium]
IRWTAFDSGFAYKDFFVFARTFPDSNASRAGMVLSEVFVFPLEQAAELQSIAEIQDAFSATLSEAKENHRTLISIKSEEASPAAQSKEDLPPGLANIVRHLLAADAAGDADKPVVWVGQEGFGEAVAALWSRLPADWRRDFNFRLSFAPEDNSGQKWTLVCTPQEFASRWANFRTASPRENATAFSEDDLSAAFLLGKPEGKPLVELLDELGSRASDLKSLRFAEQSAQYRRRAEKEKLEFSERLAYVRRLGILSPGARSGVKLKNQAFSELMAQLKKEGTADNLFALNNLDITPFTLESANSLQAATADWLNRNFWKTPAPNLFQILLKAGQSPPESFWARGIAEGLKRSREGWQGQASADFFWKAWREKEELFALTEKALPATKQATSDLTKTCPRRLSPPLGDKVRRFAERQKAIELHAVVVSAYLETNEAVAAQLQFEDRERAKRDSGLSLLFERLPFDELLGETLRRTDERLFELVARQAQKSPAVLKQIQIENPAWQRIALFCLKRNAAHFWQYLGEPQSLAFSILDLLLSEKLEESELTNFVGESGYADFTLYPQRTKIWKWLKNGALQLSLEKTAASWWQRFIENSINVNTDNPEEPLRREVLRDERIESALRQ